MANQITDNRTLIDAADSAPGAAPGWTDLSGAFGGITLDTEIKIENTGSIGQYATTTRDGIFYQYASDQNLANNHIYFWVNCGIVGLLDTKANGGLTFRARGPTISNYLEWELAGSDAWPVTVEGGWAMFVVDLESTPTNTGGTPPLTSAIRSLGITFITATVMPRMADNTWMDAMHRLPDGSPGIIVEGRNGGATDWDFSDVVTQLGVSNGTFKQGPGGSFTCNTPIQIGINDTTIHGFADTNKTLLWEDQEFVANDLYSISALGNSGGTTNVTLGVKSGTGDDATGAQGGSIQAAASGVRWALDFDDPNLDSVGLYGVSLQHGGTLQLDDPAVEVISCLYIDCDKAFISNSLQLRNKIIDANTADGVAFMDTDDLTDIRFCEFEFSDGHGVEVTGSVTPQTSKGNKFSGYGAIGTNDAGLYNNSGTALEFNVTNGGDTFTYRNGASASTTINNNVSVTYNGLVNGSEVRVFLAGTKTVVDGIESVVGNQFSWSVGSGVSMDINIYGPIPTPPAPPAVAYNVITQKGISFSADTTLGITQTVNLNYKDAA